MYSLLQDVRFAFRQLRKFPGFTVLAVVTLALGIGANTAMFTVAESVLIRPLPYVNADRLVYIGPAHKEGFREGFQHTSWLNCRDIGEQATNLEATGCYSEDIGVVQGKDGSQTVVTPGITPSVISLLGSKPLLGRTFTAEEGEAGGPQSALLSEGLWREAFQADARIIGQVIRVNGRPRIVVGVMPGSFRFPEAAGADIGRGLWLTLQPSAEMLKERGYNLFSVIGRLKPGVTPAGEQLELNAIAQHIGEIDSQAGKNLAFRIASYQNMLTGPVGPVFLALIIALGLVLLIASANVANLLIARCMARQHEFAVRAAIGASGSRLARQLIVEGAVLSALGCGFGFALAYLTLLAVHKLPPDTIPRSAEISLHWTVIVTLAGIATVTTILSTLVPALLVSRSDPQKALQAASRGVGTQTVKGRISGLLIAAEVSLSVLLLIGTGLLFRTLWNLQHTRLGFEVSRVSSFSAMPADAAGFTNMAVSQDVEHAPPSVAVLIYEPVLERLRTIPGVQDAALATAPPLSGIGLGTTFDIVGKPHDRDHPMNARVTAVSEDYTRLLSTPVLRGRMISAADGAQAPYVIAINDALARQYFAGMDPIGQQLDLGGKDTGMLKPYTVVGVIGDQIDDSLSQEPRPLLLIPYRQIPTTSLYYQGLIKTVVNFVVKTRSDVAVAPAARAVFKQTAPDYALDNFRSMQQAVDESSFSHRLGLYVTGAFAGMAVLMVIAGLYGVLSQLTGYRRREFGIRLALGGAPGGILWMVLRQALLFVATGLAVGLTLALFAGKLLKTFLFGVQPTDIVTISIVVLALLCVACAAALVPAQRAAATDPMNALREE
jgi:putative ABC transport system permease protein